MADVLSQRDKNKPVQDRLTVQYSNHCRRIYCFGWDPWGWKEKALWKAFGQKDKTRYFSYSSGQMSDRVQFLRLFTVLGWRRKRLLWI